MKMFNTTRKLMISVSQLSILLVAVCSIQTVYAQYPDPTIDLGTEGQFLWKEGTELGRTANLTNIGPYLVNLPEAPGSSGVALDGNGLGNDTIWDLSDLANPVMVHEFSTRGQPIQAHATIIRFGENGPRLVAGGSGMVGYNASGATIQERLIFDRGDWPYGIFSHSHMTSPYVTRSYWSYNLNRNGVFAIHDTSTALDQPADGTYSFTSGPLPELFGYDIGVWMGVPYLYWDHFAVADVTGFTSFNGNLMIQASDQLNNGMAIYDISGMKEGRMPRLLSVYQPELQEPDGNPVGIGGYWVEPYGATKMVFAARESSSDGRGYPAMYVIDFEDPRNPYLSCEVYFDQNKTTQGWGEQANIAGDVNSGDGDVSSDPMYVNFQDQYAYVDHFRVDIEACESAMAAGNAITGPIFDEVVYKFDDIANQCDSSQYFRPLGQLGVFGGYDWWRTPNVNEQGMCGFVTSDEPDTRAPYISGHRPLTGQTNYPIDGFVHIHVPETLRTETVENAVVITNTATNETVAFQYQLSHTGTISIFPDNYFAPNTSYRVDVRGIQDFMGNTMENYSFTFSTDDGNLLQGETPFPPFDYDNPPAPGVIGVDAGGPTGPAPTYTGPSYFPNQSSPISCEVDTETGKIWTVNPDNDSISIISSSMGVDMVKSHQVDSEIRILYEAPTSVTRMNEYYAVTYRDDDKVVFFTHSGDLVYAVDTGHGTQPVASVGDSEHLYVALYGSGEVIKINTADRDILSRLTVGAKPKAMALYQNRLLVTRFISPTTHGEVYDVNTDNNMTLSRVITVNKLTVGDDIDHGGGVPNYLSSIVISNDGALAYVAATKANTDRGLRPGSTNPQALDGDNTVRPMIATLDLLNNRDSNQNPSTRDNTIDLDNGADPSAISFLVNPDIRVTALQGNNILLFNNTQSNSAAQFNTGGAPQGMCATRRTLYVKNFTGRSVSAIDIAGYLESGSLVQQTTEISTVRTEVLSAEEKTGLEIFYHSSMPEMGVEGYMTCASCHAGGGHDGRVWDNTSFGEGLRNTISLNGSSGTRFGPLHWSSNFDEVQDFELQIETLNGGTGLIPGQTFSGESPLEMITTGQSIDLDALAAYVSGLGKDTVKRSPNRTYTGELSAAAIRGQAVFTSTDLGGSSCASCHSGPAFRDGQSHDMGTITVASGSRLNGALTAIRTPSLIELWDSAPYFHDGSAATLEDVLTRGNHTRNYTATQRQDLIEYLRSIDRELYIDDDASFDVVSP
jgi:hypothetical protein